LPCSCVMTPATARQARQKRGLVGVSRANIIVVNTSTYWSDDSIFETSPEKSRCHRFPHAFGNFSSSLLDAKTAKECRRSRSGPKVRLELETRLFVRCDERAPELREILTFFFTVDTNLLLTQLVECSALGLHLLHALDRGSHTRQSPNFSFALEREPIGQSLRVLRLKEREDVPNGRALPSLGDRETPIHVVDAIAARTSSAAAGRAIIRIPLYRSVVDLSVDDFGAELLVEEKVNRPIR